MAKGKVKRGCGVVVVAFFGLFILSGLIKALTSDGGEPETNPTPQKVTTTEPTLGITLEKAEVPQNAKPLPKLKERSKKSEVKTQAPRQVEGGEIADKAETLNAPTQVKPSTKALAALIPTPSRKWNSPDGRSVLGIVSEFDPVAGVLTLRTAIGEHFSDFPMGKFTEADQQYLRDISKGILTGRVVGVHDGDSITLLVAGNTQFKIRLEAIDAPELGQEFGNNAKQGLGGLVHGRKIKVVVTGLDKYKRILGFVFVEDKNVNHEMVKIGLAWHFKEYSDDAKLVAAEVSARNAKKGLWSAFNPMSPWAYRDLQKSNAAAAKLAERLKPSPFTSTGEPSTVTKPAASYWLNTGSNTRHNSGCRWYHNTKSGRSCTKSEGSACGKCGG